MVAIIKPYREIEINNQIKFAGHVHVKKVDRSGRVTFETKYKNLLTDYFIQYGFSESSFGTSQGVTDVFVGILLGTGVQTEPQPSDTALNNFLEGGGARLVVGRNSISLAVLGATPADDYLSASCTTTFDYGQANGALTEIGLAVGGSGVINPSHPDHRLLAKSLIKDSNGNPVVVNKTDAEQLIVRYEIRVYRSNEPEATFNIGGSNITVKLLSYSRTNGVATDIDTDQTGRGTISGDAISGWRDLTKVSLERVSPSEGHIRINPTTAPRDIYSLLNFVLGFGRGSSDPYTLQTASINTSSIQNSMQTLVFINPTTRAREAVTLPANYRMEMGFSFERGRK